MEAARTSETLVNFYQTTRCYNPEDSNLHTHRRENLKSYLLILVCAMAQAISHWPPTAAAQVHTRVNPVGFMVDKVAL
jgi:hypothetical protein